MPQPDLNGKQLTENNFGANRVLSTLADGVLKWVDNSGSGSGATLGCDITATETIGGIAAGDELASSLTLCQIFNLLLVKYQEPGVDIDDELGDDVEHGSNCDVGTIEGRFTNGQNIDTAEDIEIEYPVGTTQEFAAGTTPVQTFPVNTPGTCIVETNSSSNSVPQEDPNNPGNPLDPPGAPPGNPLRQGGDVNDYPSMSGLTSKTSSMTIRGRDTQGNIFSDTDTKRILYASYAWATDVEMTAALGNEAAWVAKFNTLMAARANKQLTTNSMRTYTNLGTESDEYVTFVLPLAHYLVLNKVIYNNAVDVTAAFKQCGIYGWTNDQGAVTTMVVLQADTPGAYADNDLLRLETA